MNDRASDERLQMRVTPRGVTSTAALGEFQELWAHLRIAAGLVQRQLRLRYKGSALGIFWSMIPPIIQVFVLTVVVGKILGAGPANLSAYMFCAFLPWIFVSNTIIDSAGSVIDYLSIMKKSYFPRELMPIAGVVANFIHFLVGLGVFLLYRYVFTTITHGWPGLPPREILWFPLVVFDMVILTAGLSFLFSAWATFYEDVKFIILSGLQLMFYALPIIYFAEQIFYSHSLAGSPVLRSALYHLYLANPLAWIITAFKQMFIGATVIKGAGGVTIPTAPFDWRYLLLTTGTSLLVLAFGYREFRRLKWKFVERP